MNRDRVSMAMVINQGPGNNNEGPVNMASDISIRNTE